MPITKTVTPAVIEANRKNSKKSTGPRTESGKQNARLNAFKHGLLARHFVIHDHDERLAFHDLRIRMAEGFQPEGWLETLLVDEITVLFKRLQMALRIESRELEKRDSADVTLSGVLGSYSAKLPIGSIDLPVDETGWEFERVTVRTSGESQNGDKSIRNQIVANTPHPSIPIVAGHSEAGTGKSLEVEAVLGNTIDRLTRYQSALKRDFYRAVELLRKIQAERKGKRRRQR